MFHPVSCTVALLLLLMSGWSPVDAGSAVDAGRDALGRGDYDRAVRKLRQPAADGDPEAVYLLATLYLQGRGVPQDVGRGEAMLRRSAEADVAEAQRDLARLIALGEIQGARSDAIRWYERAALNGDADAGLTLGRIYLLGSRVDADPAAALTWFRSCATAKSVCAVEVGIAYAEGRGVDRDHAAAATWFERAAEAGSVSAEAELKRMRCAGRIGQADPAGALRRLERLADDSNAAAEVLAKIYLDGDAGPSDPVRAFAHAQQSQTIARAANVMSAAQLERAVRAMERRYQDGEYAKSVPRIEALASRGVKRAQYHLGVMQALAFGLPQDLPQALKWLELSGFGERADVASLVARIHATLAPEDVADVMAGVSAWQPEPWQPAPPTDAVRSLPGISVTTRPVVVPGSKTKPRIPDSALRTLERGTVLVLTSITTEGRILDPFIVSSTPPGRGFEQAALDAIVQWRYEPAQRDGRPVESETVVVFQFN